MKKEFTLPEKEYRKKQIAFYNELNKGSHKNTFTPCRGTVVKQVDEVGTKTYAQINHKASFKAPRAISSTKIGNDRTQKHKTVRAGRYQPQMLTIVLLMKMTKEQLLLLMNMEIVDGLEFRHTSRKDLVKLVNIDRHYAFRPK